MNLQQVVIALEKAFIEEKTRFGYRRALIFWYDPEKAFVEAIDEITAALDDVRLLRLDKESQLGAKVLLEIDDRENSYLVYAPLAQPVLADIESDWLYSTRAYSRMFYAEETSLVIEEFGLVSAPWREFLHPRLEFFRKNKNRRERLKKLGVDDKTSFEAFDLRLMAAASEADYADIFQILPRLFSGFIVDGGDVTLENAPKAFQKFADYGIAESFWHLIERTFGYGGDDPADFLRRLFVTDFQRSLKANFPDTLQNLVLPKAESAAFLSAWRNNSQFSADYRLIAGALEGELNFDEKIQNLHAEDLSEVQTFKAVEISILREIRDELLKPAREIPFDRLKRILEARRSSFWTQNRETKFAEAIEALNSALEIFRLRLHYDKGFNCMSREEMFTSYTENLYRFDQLYRLFHENNRLTNSTDLLKSLSESVDNCYLNWFLSEIGECWGNFISDDAGRIENWRISGVPSQQKFFQTHVKPILDKNPQSKVYVIISDAFRFEAVAELEAEIKRTSVKGRGLEANLSAQLGVLPSYTTLGMASLLPHETISYTADAKDVLVDGVSTSGIKNRQKILAKFGGTAIHLKELLEKNTEQGREFARPHRVIYVYHDDIDKTGDTAGSEHKTFDAVRTAIDEIKKAVDFIVKSLDGGHILVTADHGFLFQQTTLEKFNKSEIIQEPAGTIVPKKRYIIGKNLGTSAQAYSGRMRDTAQTSDEMEFWIPRGANRFHFSGGARFVHGGAMPQEVVVPVLYVRVRRGKEAEKIKVKPVDVILLGESNRIVTNIHRYTFLQSEPVAERRPARTLEISLRDDEQLISDEVTVIFDSPETDSDKRRKSVRLHLSGGTFDRRREYSLVLRDARTKIEYRRFPVFIDLALTSDF